MLQVHSDISSKALLKRFALLYLPIVIVLSIIMLTSIRFEKQIELNRLEDAERNRIEIAKAGIMQDFEGVDSDLRVLASLPLLRNYLDTGSPAQLDELARYFQLLSKEKRQYNVVRYLDAGGQEVVRINFNNSKPSIVPQLELRNEFKRYYFNDTFRLNRGEVYVSPLDLGLENSHPVTSLIPTIRFGTPVFDNAGHKKGVILFDYSGSNLLQSFHKVMQGQEHAGMLINREGYWLGSVNPADQWGGLKTQSKSDGTFAHDFADEWSTISKGEEGALLTDKGLFVYSTVHPLLLGQVTSSDSDSEFAGTSQLEFKSDEYYWKIVSFTPSTVLLGDFFYNQTSNRVMLVIGYLFFALASFVVARTTLGRNQAETEIRIAATAFESNEGILVTDTNNTILRVNKAFTHITGYSSEEVVGKTPKILSSGRHDEAFFASMWESINNSGSWDGEIWNRRKNGEIYPEQITITAVKNEGGYLSNYIATFSDISLTKAAEEEIKHLAFYDHLTRLPNRRLLLDRLQQAIASSARSRRQSALLFVDLDNFKILNDTLGHDIGDLLLQEVAHHLVSCVRQDDSVGRLGGDEFVVILENLSEHRHEAADQTEAVGNKILSSLNQGYQLSRHNYHNSSSIGATIFNGHERSIDQLFKQADIALFQAKKAGRNTLKFFDPKMQETLNDRTTLEVELRKAIENHEFQLYYQIQVEGSLNHRPYGAEALIRWIHPDRGFISPADFIPIAEETELIHSIGWWVLKTACAQIKAWQNEPCTSNLVLSVNVSAKQFHKSDFAEQVKAAIQFDGINPKLLKLELTESMLHENIEATIATMSALRDIGVSFSLDDFGTGYSSFSYLSRLPLDHLKIDRSFVMNLGSTDDSVAICSAIISMAHSLKLKVVAEGVENETQAYILSTVHRCDYLQGYLYGKPEPIEKFDASL
jgi:diguanylate cyclase (GGDEF)-like protein/PAS domain S-box-containing protein